MRKSLASFLLMSCAMTGVASAHEGQQNYYVNSAPYNCATTISKNRNGNGAITGAIIGGIAGAVIGNNVESGHGTRRGRRYAGHRYNGYHGNRYNSNIYFGNTYGPRGHRGRYAHRSDSNSGNVVGGAIIGAVIGGVIGSTADKSNPSRSTSNCDNWQYANVPRPTMRPSKLPINGSQGVIYDDPYQYGYQEPMVASPGCQIIAQTEQRADGWVSYPVEVC